MQPTPGSSDCQIHFCCPLPDITVGQTITTDPGTDAQVRVTPTPCGAQLDFSIPRGETGTEGPAVQRGLPDRTFMPHLSR